MNIRIYPLIALLFLLASCNTADQKSTDETDQARSSNDESTIGEDRDEAVKMTVITLFDGVRESDKEKIRSVLAENSEFISSREKEGELIEKITKGVEFAEKAGEQHEKIWDERLFEVKVELNQKGAELRARYEFYLGEEYSHKGDMKVELINPDGRWLIQKVWYTVVKD